LLLHLEHPCAYSVARAARAPRNAPLLERLGACLACVRRRQASRHRGAAQRATTRLCSIRRAALN
jgi:hypothetical protein